MMKITKEDYLNFRNINLEIELKNKPGDNPTKKVDSYLGKITDFIFEYIDEHFVPQKYNVPNIDEVYKKAILYQVEYFLEHGDLSLYNPRELPLLSAGSYRVLKNAGLANVRGF